MNQTFIVAFSSIIVDDFSSWKCHLFQKVYLPAIQTRPKFDPNWNLFWNNLFWPGLSQVLYRAHTQILSRRLFERQIQGPIFELFHLAGSHSIKLDFKLQLNLDFKEVAMVMMRLLMIMFSHCVFEDKLWDPYLCRFTWQETIQADIRLQVLQSAKSKS